MSEDIRKMIDKVKTFKQFINEGVVDNTKMNAIELVKTASAEGTRFEMKVFVELDNANKIQWNGGNSLNKSAAYCVKKNDKGMALFMMSVNPVQEWHFVGKISE